VRFDPKCPPYLIDAVGAACLMACTLGAGWLVFVEGDRTKGALAELSSSIGAAGKDLADIQAIRDRQMSLLRTRERELGERGHLPEQTPIEEYFQTLAGLAARHRLNVLRHQPLTVRNYPGLAESRYAYEVTGTFPDLMEFLRAVEHTQFWADVSYLRIHTSHSSEERLDDQRTALLTVSVFSAAPSPQPGAGVESG